MAFAGPRNRQGPGATISIGAVRTGAPGTPAKVANVGTPTDAILDFVIPRGEDGEDGEDGRDLRPEQQKKPFFASGGGGKGDPGEGVPPGGNPDDVLTKVSGADYHTEWRAPSGGGGGGVATQAPKLVQVFDTDVSTLVTHLVRVSGASQVTRITDNDALTIPNGIFGVVTSKPTTTTAGVLFIGIQGGFSGLTTGGALYVNTDGTPTHSAPATGTLQQIGFAVSATEIFFYNQQPIRRA